MWLIGSALVQPVCAQPAREKAEAIIDHLLERGVVRESDLRPEELRFLREPKHRSAALAYDRLLGLRLSLGRERHRGNARSPMGRAQALLVILRAIDDGKARSAQTKVLRRLLSAAFCVGTPEARWLQDAALEAGRRDVSLLRTLADTRPDVLLSCLSVEKPNMNIIEELGRRRFAPALPVLEKILDATPVSDRRDRLAMMVLLIKGEPPKEKFRKSTPREAIESYARYLRNTQVTEAALLDEEWEFWGCPGFDRKGWQEFKARYAQDADLRHLKSLIMEVANAFAQGKATVLFEPYRGTSDEAASVAVDGIEKISLRKDVFGCWRLW